MIGTMSNKGFVLRLMLGGCIGAFINKIFNGIDLWLFILCMFIPFVIEHIGFIFNCITDLAREEKYLNSLPLDLLLVTIKKDPSKLLYVKNQTEEICMAAVEQDLNAFSRIKDPRMKELILEKVNAKLNPETPILNSQNI